MKDQNTATFRNPACVFLEAELEDGDLFAGHRVEERLNDPLGKPVPLVVVQRDHLQQHDHLQHHCHILQIIRTIPGIDNHHLRPVVRHLWQVKALTDVDKVEQILLETRPAKSDTCLR